MNYWKKVRTIVNVLFAVLALTAMVAVLVKNGDGSFEPARQPRPTTPTNQPSSTTSGL